MTKFTKDNTVDSTEVKDERIYKTSLYYHHTWNISDQERYIYQYHHTKLPKMIENQLSFSGINFVENEDHSIVLTAFIRNAFKKLITLQNVVLTLVDGQNRKVASKLVDLTDLGSLPPMTSVPWRFLFNTEDRFTLEAMDKENWRVLVDLKPKLNKPTLDLDPLWEKQLNDTQIGALQRIVDQQPTLVNKNDFNLMGLELHSDKTKREVIVNVFMRNTTEAVIHLDSITLGLEDAFGSEVLRNDFSFDKFEVKPNTYKPWTFTFPLSEEHIIEEMDFRRWRVNPVNTQTLVN
ncbi:SLAP domain-containing protein [Rossellomorea vietnamensis]|uniref:SLAP domain-containing protein n=1 Tax=Rossellomorea vietnamensis TaxID=218284 RepID=UPI003D2814B2